MIVVKTYLDKSNIQGIGLFAGEFIPENTIVWKFDPNVDMILPESIVNVYDSLKKYHWKNKNGKCVVPLDDDRFINHSRNPNLINVNEHTMAVKHAIFQGTELLADYRELMPESEWEDYY